MDTVAVVKSSCEFENNMLNLLIGKRYSITLFAHDTPMVGTIKSKEAKDKSNHTYWFSWWDEARKQNVGHYIFDRGYANTKRTIVYNQYSIRTCKEVCPNIDPKKD